MYMYYVDGSVKGFQIYKQIWKISLLVTLSLNVAIAKGVPLELFFSWIDISVPETKPSLLTNRFSFVEDVKITQIY